MIVPTQIGEPVQLFTPLPKQEAFLFHVLERVASRFIWYCGGFGSGKSFIGSQTAVRLAMSAPNGRGLIARQTLVDIKATTMKTFFEVLDKRLIRKWNKSENLLTLINGHEIYFWGLDDIEKLKSLELGWFWIDEVNEVAENTFNVLKGRLRHKAQPKRVGMLTSNSEGKNWTYKQFIQGRGIRTAEDLAKYIVIKAPSNENTFLPDDYLEVLNSYTGDLYERYVQASFNVFEGQIFPELGQMHIIRPFEIPENWTRIAGLDHGERNPTAGLWAAVSPQGDIYFYREYYKAGEFVPEHVRAITEMQGEEDIEYLVIDPSTKSVRGASGRKIDQEYKEEWEKITGKKLQLKYANNDVSAGIARVHRYLRVDKTRVHPVTKKQGAPRVFIFNTCTKFLEEMESYKWAKQSSADENDPQEKVRKKDDHTCDVARYMIMSRPDIVVGGVIAKYGKKAERQDEDQLLNNVQSQFPSDFIKLK